MEYRHYYLAKKFIEKHCNVYIISGSYSHLYKNLPEIKGDFTFENIEGINYIWVKVPEYKTSTGIKRVFNMLVFMFQLFKFNTKNIEKPDSIIISSPSPFPILNGYLWAKKFKAKLIFEVRDLWPLSLIELNNMSKYHPLIIFMQWFENFAYKKSDIVVSLLPNAKKYMLEHELKEKKFKYIPNGINLEEMNNIEPLAPSVAAQIPKDKFIVGYTGTLGKANAMKYFVEAAQILSNRQDIHFLIVGDGGEKAQLLEKAKGLKNITFIGTINKIQIQSMIKFFDLCFIGWNKRKLYEYGVSANKIFDYMYSGKPVLNSIDTSNDPIETADCGVIVEPENTESIVQGILSLFNMQQQKREQIGQNGHKYVIENHSYEKLAEKYMDLF